LKVLLFLLFQLLFDCHQFRVVVGDGASDDEILFREFLFYFGEEVVEVVVLLSQVGAVLSQFGDFFSLFSFELTQLSLFVLQCAQQFLVFPDENLFAVFDHFHFLFEGSGELLYLFYFIISDSVFDVSDFLFEGEFVADEDVVEFFVLHGEVLGRGGVTFRDISRALFFYYRFLILRSN
jgi:hypothetical protein